MKVVAFGSVVGLACGQGIGTQTSENHPKIQVSECSSSGCNSKAAPVTIDANWRWLHTKGTTTNCYTGNTWSCGDEATCTSQCVVEGADQEYTNTYGIKASGNSLQLDFVTQGPYSKNIGSRTYLMEDDDNYQMLKLKNKEFTVTVDDSQLGCGLNGALYFVQMQQDGGKSSFSAAGAKYGTGYCDAQCPHDIKFINGKANVEDWKPSETDANAGTGKYGSCCTEIDLWEANSISTAFTMHACTEQNYACTGTDCGDNGADRFKGVCDKNGCDMQANRLHGSDAKFWGPGSGNKIDSTKPVTVTTQFITADGTDSGEVTQVKQFYTQNGQTIEHPQYSVNGNQHDRITDEYCADWVATTEDGTNFLDKGGMKGISEALENGVVLVMSLWDDHAANMLWLDSTYPVDSSDPGAYRGSCSADSGIPKDVESKTPNANVKFSDIKWGPLGSTTGGPVPPSPAPAPSPAPSPTPSGDCPGGSLDNCIDLCPIDVFAACVKSCQRRCASVFV